MNRLALLALAALTCAAQSLDHRHLILISVDGMRPIEYRRDPSNVPGIQALAKAGCAATGARPVFPTVTYPNHTAMITGQPPAVSGILSNTIFDPFNQTSGGWYWYAERIKTPTLWQVVKNAGGKTASIGWPVTVGADIDYLVPEFRQVRHPDDRALMKSLSTRGLYEAIEKTAPDATKQDAWKASAAAYIFETYKPSLMMIHLADVDHEQHEAGIDSTEAVEALHETDRLIEMLKKRVETAAGGDPVTWMIVSDHGFQKVEKQFNPKVAVRDLGLIDNTKQGTLESWRVFPRVAGGAFALVAKDPNDTEAIERTTKYFEFLARDPKIGIRKLYYPDDLKRLGSFPDAFLAGDTVEGFTVGSSGEGALATSTSTKGMHGYDPENPRMQASFLLSGSNAAHCSAQLEGVQLVDVAPTAAAILGIEFPASAGHVQLKAIKQ